MDEKLLEKKRARHRERMATDLAYVEAQRQKALRAYNKRKDRDRELINANWRTADARRRAADPDYTAKRLARQNDRRRNRLATDEKYLERHRMDRRLAEAYRRFGSRRCSWYFRGKIREIYEDCPEGSEVDHIEPLFTVKDGIVVACGLHVPDNLQYLTHEENARKANSNPSAGAKAWRRTYAGVKRRKIE